MTYAPFLPTAGRGRARPRAVISQTRYFRFANDQEAASGWACYTDQFEAMVERANPGNGEAAAGCRLATHPEEDCGVSKNPVNSGVRS
jgi:hypothetical protein